MSGRLAAVMVHTFTSLASLQRLGLPVLAAVHGRAIGGGLALAMLADWRACTADAVFDQKFAQHGISPGMASSVTIPPSPATSSGARVQVFGDVSRLN